MQYTTQFSKCCSVSGTEHSILKDNYSQFVVWFFFLIW